MLTVLGSGLQPQTSAEGEGFAAELAFLGQVADLRSNLYFVPEYSGFTPLATMTYGSQYISKIGYIDWGKGVGSKASNTRGKDLGYTWYAGAKWQMDF